MSCKSLSKNIVSHINERSLFQTSVNRKILRDKIYLSPNLFAKDLKAHFGCVNAIEFSNRGGELIASGGDDRRVLIWNVQKALSDIGQPRALKGEHNSNIFCLSFDSDNTKVFSGGNDEQVIVHDLNTGETLDVFLHEDAVYGVSVDPFNSNVFASACDDGRILIYDIRLPPASADAFCLASYTSSMHAVMYNPVEPRLLATANAKEGLGLWDVRKPKSCVLRYGGGYIRQSANSVRISRSGDRILALRRRLPPILYNIDSSHPICEFDQDGYFNSCTMKSCSFAGDNDQYVLSGSDDFKLYMWKIPDDLSQRQYVKDAHMVLSGHRSIVNQVRFNPDNHLVISSGVEKLVKVWSPFQLPNCSGLDKDNENDGGERAVYSHEEYINLILNSGQFMTHDYTNRSVEEDPRMIAFFDSLVQRELEGNSSEGEMSSNEAEMFERIVQLSRSDISDSSDDEQPEDRHSDTDSIEDPAFSPFTIAFASVMAAQATDNNESASRLLNSLGSTERNENTQSGTGRSITDMIAKKRQDMKKQLLENKKKSKKRKKISFESSESSEEESPSGAETSLGHVSNVLSAQRQRRQLQLKRLKQLRDDVLTDQSENVPDAPTNNCKTSVKSDRVSFMEPSTSKGNPEYGPYLHKNTVGGECSKDIDRVTSSDDHKNHHTTNCDKESHGDDFEPVPGGSSETLCSVSGDQSCQEEENREKWCNFKRFKNKSSKNKRIYRKNSDK